MRLTGVATENLMEAGQGAAWGEDPRYFLSPERGFGQPVRYVVKTTFMAPHRDGRWYPAYARFAGDIGNNFLSNAWRADSEANTSHAIQRCMWGLLGRMGSNAFAEFWPDIRRKVFRKQGLLAIGSADGSTKIRFCFPHNRVLLPPLRSASK